MSDKEIVERVREDIVKIIRTETKVHHGVDGSPITEDDVVDEIIALKNLTAYDPDAELPKNPWAGWKSILDPTILGMNRKRAEAYKLAGEDMKEAGWVKGVKNE